jgi:hypothetical protein
MSLPSRFVTHGFAAVAVRIDDECRIVGGVVFRARSPGAPSSRAPAARASEWKRFTLDRSGARNATCVPVRELQCGHS